MKFFIDTADLGQIETAYSWGCLAGVTTNPTLYARTGGSLADFEAHMLRIAELCDGLPVSAESTAATADAIDEAMRDSVRYHNVADVEVGSFLSSGIDSSYMAACLAAENPGIKTFTVGFAEYEGERDEISWAAELADELKVRNTSHHITEEEYTLPLLSIAE